jgi:hypothetical protein
MKMTLPTDSAERKNVPLFSGVLKYAPAALAGMARISKLGNDKHNPGEPLHHARGKSNDHPDCVVRHAVDVADIEAALQRSDIPIDKNAPLAPGAREAALQRSDIPIDKGDGSARAEVVESLLNEVSQLVWRAALWSQELHERYGNAPLAPGAREACAEPKVVSAYPAESPIKLNRE